MSNKICLEEGCDKPVQAKGLCNMHYRRVARAKDPLAKQKALEYTRAWKKANPEKHAAQQARKHARYKDKINANTAQWKRDNWDTYKNYLSARKHRVKQATPPWANMDDITAIYANRPEGFHVDHIVPLNGKNVSGLHLPWNLQYLPAEANLKKSNKA